MNIKSMNTKSRQTNLKITSFLMAILMVLCLFPVTAIVAEAGTNGVDAATVVAHMEAKVGQSNQYVGYCLLFVSKCWEEMGFQGAYGLGSAKALADTHIISTSKNDIPIGADVFFYDPNYPTGHIGIYIGDGWFVHAGIKSTYEKSNLFTNSYYSRYYTGWGWHPYVTVTNSTEPYAQFTPWSSDNYTYIRDTDASIGQHIVAGGGSWTEVGMILYDADGKELGRGSNNPDISANTHNYCYYANQELGITLIPGTEYKYKFYAIVGGKTFYSEMDSFTTTGTKPSQTISGYCGGDTSAAYNADSEAYENLWWTLDEDGTLTIGGEGEMKSYDTVLNENVHRYVTSAPWGQYLDQLKTLVIKNGVTSIGDYALFNCRGLIGDLVLPNSVASIGVGAFAGCSGFTGELVIPNGVKSIDYAFAGCSGFTGDLVIPDSVTSIGELSFQGCSGFNGNLVIGNSVTSIGNYAFLNCSGFTGDLVIPNSVTSIGEGAFCDCSGFTGDLVIGNSVTNIGEIAFIGCSGLTGDLVIPNSVTSIGEGAFRDCSGFTGDLVIGNSVTSIGDDAFYNAPFDNVYFKGNAPEVTEATDDYASFEPDITLYYIKGKSGWTTPTWNGYKTAIWDGNVFAQAYTVTYDANGGSGAPASQTKTEGVSLTLSSTVPTLNGYTFLNWKDSDGATYAPGASYTKDKANVLTAVWELEKEDEEIDENAPHIVISNAKGKPGNTVEIPFIFNNNPGFAGGEMEIVYDKNDLKLTEITLGTLPSNTEYNVNTGKIAFGNSSNITGSGALFIAKFEILTSEDKKCGIELNITEFYNAADENITVPIIDGEVEVYNYIIGDANDDGKISSRDATIILKYVVGNVGESAINLAAADFNGDGRVTSRDATAILKYIVSQ